MKRAHCKRRAAFLFGFLFFVGSACEPLIAQDNRPQDAGTSQATEKPKSILLQLAEQCSKDIAATPDCRSVTTNEKQEYIILKDNAPTKPQAYLLIPVQPVTGVDDDQIFLPPVFDLWSSAWMWSKKYPGRPGAVTGLAINSAAARSQNQLHIHISCVLPEVTKALARKKIPMNPKSATSMNLGPSHTSYWVVAVQNLYGGNNPFAVALTIARAQKKEMKEQGIAVVRGKKNNEFYILGTSDGGGHAEELLDQSCATGYLRSGDE